MSKYTKNTLQLKVIKYHMYFNWLSLFVGYSKSVQYYFPLIRTPSCMYNYNTLVTPPNPHVLLQRPD